MPIISFANPKGGAGKTTSALLLASELSSLNVKITIIDADPEKWISQWGKISENLDNIHIITDVTEDSIVDHIEQASETSQFVIIDLEGTASLMVANAIGMSDLVIIPTQGASMDARGAAKTIKLISNQERLARRKILYSVLLTRTSAAITSRALKNVKEQLSKANISVFKTDIVERAAYRDIFDYGGLLSNLTADQVNNIDKARKNAQEFTGEVILKLQKNHDTTKI